MSAARAGASVRTAARSRAERARGLASISASLGRHGGSRPLEGRCRNGNLRQVARACHRAGAVGDEALDDAVFQRMERDDDQPAAGLQDALGRKQRARQFAEFVIDEDAQRLEHAGSGMDLDLGIETEKAGNGLREIARALERLRGAPLLDHAGDAAGLPLLAEEVEDAGQISRWQSC